VLLFWGYNFYTLHNLITSVIKLLIPSIVLIVSLFLSFSLSLFLSFSLSPFIYRKITLLIFVAGIKPMQKRKGDMIYLLVKKTIHTLLVQFFLVSFCSLLLVRVSFERNNVDCIFSSFLFGLEMLQLALRR
jgi:hypothetical protein